MNVTISTIVDPDALYHCHDGRFTPQQAHLALDLRDGELTADYNPESGAVPESVFQQTVIWVGIPTLTATAANQLMEDVRPLAQRILDGSEVVWDGNNHVGQLNDDARDALDDLVEQCADDNFDLTVQVVGYDADDWYSSDDRDAEIKRLGITADTTDAEIAALAKTETEAAPTMTSNYGYLVLTGAEQWMLGVRDALREAVREEMDELAHQIAELAERRDQLIRRVRGFGDSYRGIGDRIWLSHSQVRRIVKNGAA